MEWNITKWNCFECEYQNSTHNLVDKIECNEVLCVCCGAEYPNGENIVFNCTSCNKDYSIDASNCESDPICNQGDDFCCCDGRAYYYKCLGCEAELKTTIM